MVLAYQWGQRKIHITKHSRGIHNAWQFWFELALVFTAQWFRLGGLRCSPLNAALCASREN
ncbi:acetyltransferase [Vibrio parahaemolyticus]|nr:acetyltransferase [Vibrio parahaemolyticus]TOL43263.1 acetyltransferase [Vibrio parahaemolyticus]TOR22590.1 acetyltransferase [Vibrio parahaemolyticus]